MNQSSLPFEMMRHSCAHLLAAAIHALWPSSRFGVGPTTKDGFYYDVEFPHPIGEGDSAQIELKMHELKAKALLFERMEWPVQQAIEYMQQLDYAKALLSALNEAQVSTATGCLRADVDWSDERMQKKILRAQQCKIPYMLVIGDKEMEQGKISIRRRDGAVVNNLEINEFIEKIANEIKARSLELTI